VLHQINSKIFISFLIELIRSRGKSAGAYQTGASNVSGQQNLSNEWIPTEAVRSI